MATKKKRVTRKELLKEPDEFITITGKIIQFARTYQNQLIYGLAAVVFIVAVVSGVRFYSNWQEGKAYDSLEKAMSQFEKNRSEKAGLNEAKQRFQNIAENYSRYHGGKLARVMYANLCYETDDIDSAVTAYTEALDDFSDDPSVGLFIQSSLGYVYEAKKDYQTAVSYFEKVATAPREFLKDEALYNLGRLYGQLGDAEKSKNAFEKILSDHPDSLYIELVRESTAG